MLILFDHGTPRGIARVLQGNTVKEARAQGWDTLSNGELLKAAEEAGFDVLLTTDTNLPRQQNLEGRKLAIVILSKNRWSLVRPVMQQIAEAVNAARPGSCTVVEIPSR
jgi:signal recognition particle subunit SEC65